MSCAVVLESSRFWHPPSAVLRLASPRLSPSRALTSPVVAFFFSRKFWVTVQGDYEEYVQQLPGVLGGSIVLSSPLVLVLVCSMPKVTTCAPELSIMSEIDIIVSSTGNFNVKHF